MNNLSALRESEGHSALSRSHDFKHLPSISVDDFQTEVQTDPLRQKAKLSRIYLEMQKFTQALNNCLTGGQ
jgi:hypothetical protein